MLTAASQVLMRNQEYLEAENILVINHSDDGFAEQLCELYPTSQITGFTSILTNSSRCELANFKQVVAAELPKESFDLVIMFYPKAKAEALMLLDNIRAIATEQTRLLIAGENKGGVKSAPKQLKNAAQYGRKVDSARHCSLFQFNELAPYSDFNLTDYATHFSITVAQTELNLVTLPGVFSHGELDKGTELLLSSIKLDKPNKLLDFATGCGVISTFLAKQYADTQIVATDVSALALAAAKMTFDKNNISAELILADGISSLTEKFDQIVSNPPFHKGLNTNYDITQHFIADAKKHLYQHGQLFVVANSFLPYADAFQNQFGGFTKLVNNKQFTVYSAIA
jgi:16S rRNA (guanine1207-N2)-methyltransferase